MVSALRFAAQTIGQVDLDLAYCFSQNFPLLIKWTSRASFLPKLTWP